MLIIVKITPEVPIESEKELPDCASSGDMAQKQQEIQEVHVRPPTSPPTRCVKLRLDYEAGLHPNLKPES